MIAWLLLYLFNGEHPITAILTAIATFVGATAALIEARFASRETAALRDQIMDLRERVLVLEVLSSSAPSSKESA